jgi:hypothetical protein
MLSQALNLGYDTSRVVKNWNALNQALKLARDKSLRRPDYQTTTTDDTIYPSDYAQKIIR